MDDIGIATREPDLKAHVLAVSAVLALAAEHDLYFKPEKCLFHAPAMDYLGVILEKGVTRMDPVKVEGVRNWPTPKTVKEVRSWHGFCNFYRPFVRGFAEVMLPLNALTKKDAPWQWGHKEQRAFEDMKQRITTEPILAHPQLDQPFELETDASGYAIGAVLLQRKEDHKRHPVGYYSATLNAAERNYDVYDLELLAVVKALEHYRPLLAGSPHKIKVWSDHMNLKHWRDPRKITRRVAREVLALAEYDIEIHHLPGKSNTRADALSRRADYDVGEHDNENITVLPDALFIRAATSAIAPLEEVQDEHMLKPWVEKYQLLKIHGAWYKEGRRVLTGTSEQKRSIIAAHHDPPAYGHPGRARTTQLVARHYWWPTIKSDSHEFVAGCAECQRHKSNPNARKAALYPISLKPDATPFEVVAMDFITKLPQSQGYDSILTITDHDCSKAVILIPCKETITAEGVAALYIQHVFSRYGLPSKVISDRDPRFASKFMRALCDGLQIRQNISTAYHPRTDGQSERTNQWLEQYLRFWVKERQTELGRLSPYSRIRAQQLATRGHKGIPFFPSDGI